VAPAPSPPLQVETPRHLADRILASREALEGERKQVTVLFADVVGSTELIQDLDPEEARALLEPAVRAMLTAVHRFEGTVCRVMGDGIMALFGAPIAHEDHAVRACHAALTIQAGVRLYAETTRRQHGTVLAARVGANSGEVIVRLISDDVHADYTAMGQTVHLASRMEQLAQPGSSVITAGTLGLVRGFVQVQPLGRLSVKGLAEGVEAYELVGHAPASGHFQVVVGGNRTRFVGRDHELERLTAAAEAARLGHGQVVSIIGEAGIGKSRLLHELKQRLSQADVVCLEGSCFSYGDIISYLPFVRVVRAIFEIEMGDHEAGTLATLRDRITELGLDAMTTTPYLAALLGLPIADAPGPTATPEVLRQRTIDALKSVILAVADQRPLVLILEDLHWSDPATVEVLAAIVAGMADASLLLVLAYRPDYAVSWSGAARHERIVLGQLTSATTAEMVRMILSRPVAARDPLPPHHTEDGRAPVQEPQPTGRVSVEVEQLIAMNTDGNPLFVEELTRSLIENGDLQLRNGDYVLTRPVERVQIPATVQGVLLSRVDRLSEPLKQVMQAASVIGRVFAQQLLARVIGTGDGLDATLARLQELELVYRTAEPGQREYSFKHVLTQEAVYDTLLRSRREQYHLAIGGAIEGLHTDHLEEQYEVLAHHFRRSGDREKAVRFLGLANGKAIDASAMEAAKRFLDDALRVLDTLPDTDSVRAVRATLLVNQGWLMNSLLQLPEYYALLRRCEGEVRTGAQPGLYGTLLARMGWCEWSFGEFERAIVTTRRAAELCERNGDAEGAGQALVHLQWSQMCRGDFAASLSSREDVLRMLEQQFNVRWHLFTFAAASLTNTWLGRWDEAMEAGLTALRQGEAQADDSVIAFAAWTLSMCLAARRDHAGAVEYGELALRKAPTPGDRAWSMATLACATMRAGDLARSIAILEQTVRVLRDARFIWSEIFAVRLGEAYWLAGQYGRATRTLHDVIGVAERCGMRLVLGAAHRLLAEVALSESAASGTRPGAAAHLERSIAILGEIGAQNELALTYACYGRLLAMDGQLDQARASLTDALELFEQLGTLEEPGRVREALAALT